MIVKSSSIIVLLAAVVLCLWVHSSSAARDNDEKLYCEAVVALCKAVSAKTGMCQDDRRRCPELDSLMQTAKPYRPSRRPRLRDNGRDSTPRPKNSSVIFFMIPRFPNRTPDDPRDKEFSEMVDERGFNRLALELASKLCPYLRPSIRRQLKTVCDMRPRNYRTAVDRNYRLADEYDTYQDSEIIKVLARIICPFIPKQLRGILGSFCDGIAYSADDETTYDSYADGYDYDAYYV